MQFSKVVRTEETSIIWHLKNCDEDEDFKFLSEHSVCYIDIPFNLITNDGDQLKLKSRLKFSVWNEDYTDESEGAKYWLRLSARELQKYQYDPEVASKIREYFIKVELVDELLRKLPGSKSFEYKLAGNDREYGTVVAPGLVKVEKKYAETIPTLNLGKPKELRIKISVTPVFVSEGWTAPSQTNNLDRSPTSSLVRDLKSMFLSELDCEDNFTDLSLEFDDGVILSGHKFIFAARSPHLRTLIESSAKQNDFNGTVKLSGVKSKAMLVIRHWLYCDELPEDDNDDRSLMNVLEEVVNGAIKLELPDLVKVLDKKLIKVCNRGNMLQLYQLAKQNGMVNATEDISKFIKE